MSEHHHTSNNLKAAFFINLLFTVIEIIGGILTNSIAIMSDAIHDLGDTLSLGVSWGFERISKKQPDDKYTFGYDRFSLLGGIVSSLVLFGGTIFILTETIPRLFDPQNVDPLGMLGLSVLGVLFNVLAYLKVHSGSSLNEKAVSLHLLEDVFGWLAIMIGSIFILAFGWMFIDPLLSIIIAIYIFVHVLRIFKDILDVLLQKVPSKIDIQTIEKGIGSIEGIIKVYHTHVWSLEGSKIMLSTHIVMPSSTEPNTLMEIKHNVREYLKNEGISHVTIECEFDR
jgi:cobalt-zinc-cadmium efflux system protein